MKLKLRAIQKKLVLLYEKPGVRKYFFNTGWMFAEKGLRLISGLFVGAYVARYLGPSQYGLLNYITSLVALFTILSNLGFEVFIIRELIKDEKRRDALLGTALLLRLIGSVLVFILLMIFIFISKADHQTQNLILVVATGTFFELFNVIDYFFQAKVWSKYVVWSQMTALCVISIFRIILVVNNFPLVWFAWSATLDFLIVALGLVYFYHKKKYNIFRWKFEMKMAHELLSYSWPMMFSSLAITIYMKIDQVMVKWMLGDLASGHYGVAVRLSELWNFIPMAICASVFPAILNAKRTDNMLYLNRIQSLFDLMVVISVGISIVMTFLSGYIVYILFGAAYEAASNVLILYIWSGVFTFLGVANGKWIIAENLQMFRMVNLIIAGILNIVLNYFLLKTVGINGAAIATLVAYAYAGYFSFLMMKKTRPVFVSMTKSFNPVRLLNFFKSSSI